MERGEIRARKKVKTAYKALLAGTAAALATGGILLVQGFQKGSPPGISSQFDAGAVPSTEKPLTVKELSEVLQEQAQASSFRFKMNTSPVFADSRGEGDWCIINSIENRHHMVVLVSDPEGRALYQSRELRPGEQEMTGYLKETLEQGEYRAVATAFAIDPESGEVAGSVETDIILTVEGEKIQKEPE